MRIKSFEFKDLETGWELEKLEFQRLNLLVGASGVGKSMILRNLLSVLNYSDISTRNPFEWSIEIDSNENIYHWSGKTISGKIGSAFKNFSKHELLRHREPSSFSNELIATNGNVIAKRVEIDYMKHETYFLNEKIPNLNEHQSLLEAINEEGLKSFKNTLEKYVPFSNEFFSTSHLISFISSSFGDVLAKLENDPNYEFWRDESYKFRDEINARTLYYLQNSKNQIFDCIIDAFKNIFPNVQTIEFKKFSMDKHSEYVLYITEKDVESPIPVQDISQGMKTTLEHIIALHLAPENSVILVDEFENSLGVNCLDAVVDLINNNERNIQFILTSHHPYIINNIPIKNWKIVLRDGTKVRAVNAEELGFKESRHDAYAQLINHDAFQTGRWTKHP